MDRMYTLNNGSLNPSILSYLFDLIPNLSVILIVFQRLVSLSRD